MKTSRLSLYLKEKYDHRPNPYGSDLLLVSQDTHLSIRMDRAPPAWTGDKNEGG